jgi:hypothetical protein
MEMYASMADGDNVTYILSADLCVLQTNGAWERFARANGGERLLERWRSGTSLLDSVSGDLKKFFRDGFYRASHSEERWEHDYECSSPTEFRRFRMIAYPFSGSFLVTHALLVSAAHEDVTARPAETYERRGVIAMCGHCRRVRRTTDPECWDWVAAYVATPADNISHGLCTACYRYYYE